MRFRAKGELTYLVNSFCAYKQSQKECEGGHASMRAMSIHYDEQREREMRSISSLLIRERRVRRNIFIE